MSEYEFWMVGIYVLEHICNLNIMHRDNWQASSLVIGEYFKSKFTANGHQIRPTNIVQDICKELMENVSYEKAWRARECAWTNVLGAPKESYAKLPLCYVVLENDNPILFTRIETDSKNIF